jgi:hypothetical protein
MPWRSVCQVRCVVISGGWRSRWVAVRQRDSSHQGLARSARAWIARAALPSGDGPPESGGRHLGGYVVRQLLAAHLSPSSWGHSSSSVRWAQFPPSTGDTDGAGDKRKTRRRKQLAHSSLDSPEPAQLVSRRSKVTALTVAGSGGCTQAGGVLFEAQAARLGSRTRRLSCLFAICSCRPPGLALDHDSSPSSSSFFLRREASPS